MRTVKVTFEGLEADNGDIILADESRLPVVFRGQATSEEILDDPIGEGDYVTDKRNNIIAMSTSNGYVIIADRQDAANVGSLLPEGDIKAKGFAKIDSSVALERLPLMAREARERRP